MKRILFALIGVLLWAELASAQFVRVDCNDLDDVAVNEETECLQTSTANGRIAGRTYLRTGGAWIEKSSVGGVNPQSGTSYTIAHADGNKLVTFSNASAIAVTLPQAGASSSFLKSWQVDVQNRGAGTVTITPTTSTIDGAASLALTTKQGVRIFSDGTNYYTQRGVGGGSGGPETDPIAGGINGIIKGDGGGGLSPASPGVDYAHPSHASTHQHGGAAEIATTTPGANAIPKAGSGGLLAPGWAGPGLYDGSQNACPDKGSTDDYVCVRAIAAASCTTHNWLILYPNTINTGAATVDPDGCGVTPIVQHDNSVLTSGLLQAGRPYPMYYDGTSYRLPPGGTGAGTVLGTVGQLARFDGTTSVGDSGCAEDGSGNLSCGDVSGNKHEFTGVTPTGDRQHVFPDASGTHTYNKSISFMIGSDTGSALADTDDQPTIWRNNIAAMTIVEVWCECDTGSSTINLQRDDGSAANILSSNLVCTTSGATGTISTSEDNLAVGDKIDFVMVTAATSGTPKRITVSIKATLD